MKNSFDNSRAFMKTRFFAIFVIAMLLIVLSTGTALMKNNRSSKANDRVSGSKPKHAGERAQALRPISSQAVGFAETRPLREIANLPAVDRGEKEDEEREAAENPTIKFPSAEAKARASVAGGLIRDGALNSSIPSPRMPTPITTFEGLGRTENIAAGFGSLSPPDTNGYVGPNHYVQQDNLLVRVWDKSGTPLTAPFRLSSLYAALGGQCAAPDEGDPIVLYDELADRWLLSQFAFTGTGTTPPFHQCIAVSKSPDPTGAYFVYDFITPGNEFPDYPKIGVWPDGYYMMVHQFTNGGPFNGSGVYSFDRVKMIAGNPTASYIYFNLNLANHPEVIGGLLPSDLDGLRPPPPGRPNTFVYFTSLDFLDPADGLRLFDFHSDFATPANSTFTERAESTYNAPLAVAAFSLSDPGSAAIPQPSPATSTTGLDAITDRLMHRMQYRNQGGYETLVMNHTVGAPASTTFGTFRAAPRYYELRSTAGGPFVVQEQATFAPGGAPGDSISRWMASAAEDNQGNLAVGYSVSSGVAGGNIFPGIRYAGRLATDPPGGLSQGEATLIDGTGRQTSTGSRWGDYSALTVDPVDDCTFWYTQEYYTAAGQAASAVGWQTRVGNFKFAQCTAPSKGTVHFTVTNCVSNALIAGAIVSIDGNPYGASLTNGTYDGSLAPGLHSYSVTKGGHTTTTGNFNITDGQITNVPVCLDSGMVHFTVTNCEGGGLVSGATVTIDGSLAGTTAPNGTLDADELAGSHSYLIAKTNFANGSGNFNIVNGQTTNTPVCLTPLANIAITKTADAPYVTAGAQVGFTVSLTNNGLTTATGMIVSDNLPGAAGTSWALDAPNSDAGWSVSGSPPSQNLVYSPTTLATGAITHVHVVSLTSGACAGTVSLDNTAGFTTGNDGSGQAMASVSVLCAPVSAGPVTVTATAGTAGPSDYGTVKAAFDAINAGTHQGAITVWILGDTTETAAAGLNASGTGSTSYTTLLMLPSGGRTISGTLATPLIDLNGADNVTIDGLNSSGNSLTISNASNTAATSTSTVRFINGATNNKVTNCTILGSSIGTLGTAAGNVLFSTSTVAGGNSNNTISKNNIGAAGGNTPSKAVVGIGTAANPNSGNLIDSNNIFDFFLASASVAGVQVGSNNNNWTISNNRIYQTATRTFTTAASRYSGISVASAGGTHTVTGNVIGFGASNGTGTTTINGTSNEFRGIVFSNSSTSSYSSIQGNTISGINQTSSRASTGTDSAAFIGIQSGSAATDAPANIGNVNGNTIGSLDGSSSIVINESSTTAGTSPVQGILDFNFVDAVSISNNKIGSITMNNGGTGTTVGFRGVLVASTTGATHTISNNTIGGGAAGSITDNIVGSYGMYGIQLSSANGIVTGNTIRNIAGNSTGVGLIVSGGIVSSASTGANTISQNVIHSLSNASGAVSNSIYGISCSLPAAANVVERNLIHSFSMTSTATTGQLVGIISSAAASTGTYKNNMVRLGIDSGGNSVTPGLSIIGLWDAAGTNNFYFNSVYIGGSGVSSASATFGFLSQVVTNTRDYQNNIFWNARSNAGGLGKNFAISVGGTAPNPAGLSLNFNDLFSTGTGGVTGVFNSIEQVTLTDWRNATGQDVNSTSADPLFRLATGDATTVDMHIFAGSGAASAGSPIAGIANDFDNDPRPATIPDIGADEIVTSSGGTIPGGTYYNMSVTNGDVLGADVTVTNQLTLNGTVSTGSNSLILECNASVVGAGPTSYVIGNLKKNYCATGTKSFEVGTLNGYSPVDVNVTAGTFPTLFHVNTVQGAHPSFPSPQYALQRYWTLAGTGVTADLTFHYLDPTDIPGTANENAFVIFKFNGGFTTPGGSVNTAANSASISGVSSFSDWTIAQPNSPSAAPVSISGLITAANGTPLGGVVLELSGGRTRRTITNANGNYRFDGVEVGSFYTVTPALANFHFSPETRSFSVVANKTDAVFTGVADAVQTANAIDANEYFVRQQYLDFLGREPDAGGLEFWAGKLNQCHGGAGCLTQMRIEVSAAFFQSQEFYDTGSFVYRLYRGALGRRVRYSEFAADRAQVIGGPNLEATKRAFAEAFVARPEFTQRYSEDTAATFVDALLQTTSQDTGVDLSSQRSNLIARYQAGSTVNESRALVLRELIDQESFANAVYNASFVEMEYMGYLRRGGEQTGYEFWLNVLNNSDSGNYRGMVCSFITSAEYQHRFSSLVTHSNAECGQ